MERNSQLELLKFILDFTIYYYINETLKIRKLLENLKLLKNIVKKILKN